MDSKGVNFSLFSGHATTVELLLFSGEGEKLPFQAIQLDPERNKTFNFWHVYVEGLNSGTCYGYRINGPRDPAFGHRFDISKVLLDPYAKGTSKKLWHRPSSCLSDDNLTCSMRSVVMDTSSYDWEGDRPLNRPMNETIIYEMHVGGFTRSPCSGAEEPGTFSAVIEKIPYLKELGVTAVELLPVFAFDDQNPLRTFNGKVLQNYWGYSTINFFSLHASYCASREQDQHIREFRDMVKALHQAGIEVILDVVFNHTEEGNEKGPVFSFKGIDNTLYYILGAEDRQFYADFSGCGNTLNCNHPVVLKFILECLRYWVEEMHIDGFRFDEASCLSRGEDGAPMQYPPVLWAIELHDGLAQTKVIAEAWDAAGLYQVGYFPGRRWSEWNGRYRDDVRQFVKGNPGLAGALATRISGSPDLYEPDSQVPTNSINFVTAHDGFTLNDLVSYDEKHNIMNGEENRDGANDNYSWNCGIEGPGNDEKIEALRERQIKNFATILLISQGVPMIVAGDEVRRTQLGNNNGYCQNNEITWFDWTLVEKNRNLFRFWKNMIAFRKHHPALHRRQFFTDETNERGLPEIMWHGTALSKPPMDDPEALALGFTLAGFRAEPDIHVMMNMYWEPLGFEIPEITGRTWHRVVDTFEPSPSDILDPGREVPVTGNTCTVRDRTIVILLSKERT